MIWHIFKKDSRLLWPIALVVALIHAVNSYVWATLGLFSEPAELRILSDVLPMIAILGLVVLVASAVYQDAIPGTTQDWLVRPIRRVDLLLAKLLIILVMAQGPLFIADLVESIADGMPLGSSLNVALADGVTKFILISLPAAILASMTRSLIELIVGALALMIIGTVPMTVIRTLGNLPPPIVGGGVDWIRPALIALLFIAAAAVILPRQYFKRATLSSRGAVVGVVLIAILANFFPWNTGFAIQRWFSPQSGLAESVSLNYEPSVGHFQQLTDAVGGFEVLTKVGDPSTTIVRRLPKTGAASIFLPLRITGLAKGSVLLLDRAYIRLMDANGNKLYSNATYLSLDGQARVATARFVASQKADSNGAVDLHQTIFIPAKDYAALKQRTVRMEIDYSLSLLQADRNDTINALDGEIRTSDATWCATRLDSDGDEVQLACMTPNKIPSCATVVLEHEPTGLRNPVIDSCTPNYAPYRLSLMPSIMNHLGANVPFLDSTGLAKYPVNGPMLTESKLVMQTFEARDHFTRRLVISEIRLADWEAESMRNGGAQLHPATTEH